MLIYPLFASAYVLYMYNESGLIQHFLVHNCKCVGSIVSQFIYPVVGEGLVNRQLLCTPPPSLPPSSCLPCHVPYTHTYSKHIINNCLFLSPVVVFCKYAVNSELRQTPISIICVYTFCCLIITLFMFEISDFIIRLIKPFIK